jgi:hypothetical protein
MPAEVGVGEDKGDHLVEELSEGILEELSCA